MRRKVEFLVFLLLLIALITVSSNLEQYVSGMKVEKREPCVVIDPGHGSSDPGKIGINDAQEKEINLKIALKLKKLLEEQNVEVVMTREDDTSLAAESDTNKKVQDMKARVQLMNESKASLVVSIHQNSYPDESIHGAQVFYYTHSEDGKEAAEILQKALLDVDPDNTRQAKADETYYILKRTTSPTVIVECGFLSNPEEAGLLITDEYQEEMAQAISQGILACLAK